MGLTYELVLHSPLVENSTFIKKCLFSKNNTEAVRRKRQNVRKNGTIPDKLQCHVRGERIKRKCHTYVKMHMNIVKMRTKIEMLGCDY
ncbi:unnamed protein product, partial [Schistosoma rodhaini]